MKVLFATSELAPWVKTGGLGDVAAALPPALRAQGVDLRILVPAYPAFKAAFPDAAPVARFPAGPAQRHDATLRAARTPEGVPLYLLDCDACFDRPGSPYLGPEGRDWLDNGERFGLLSRVAALLASAASPLDWRPEVLHGNDWQTGLAPAFLHYLPELQGPRAATVMTIHNLAFQGLFDAGLMLALGLPGHAWAIDGVEYYGHFSFLKAGLQFADAITTVSPGYAREIQTQDGGMGMDGLLRHRADRLTGILNGIDTRQWDPATDPYLAAHYDAKRLAAKAKNTAALRAEMGLPAPVEGLDTALLGLVSRLTHQKGVDLVADLVPQLEALDAQFVVLGAGDPAHEKHYRELAIAHPARMAVRIGFDEGLAHRIEAGADLFLMPSRFEPCGLNQMYSLRYGTPPVVRATGGLADTVTDAADGDRGNGFVFREATAEALLATLRRALALRGNRKAWQALQKAGMAADFGWQAPARRYAELYATLRTPPSP